MTLHSFVNWYANATDLPPSERRDLRKQARYYEHQIHQLRARGRSRAIVHSTREAAFIQNILQNRNHIIVNALREIHSSKGRIGGLNFQPRMSDNRRVVPSLSELKSELRRESGAQIGIPIAQWSVEKPNGGRRTLNKYCTLDRARQHMVSDIVQALHPISPLEYSIPGRGRDALVQSIVEHVRNGVTFWMALDIRNAFPSINIRHVSALLPDMPEVLSVTCVPIRGTTHNYPTDQQLPQGGLASQSILGAIVGREAQALTSLPRAILTYSDNVWIGAPTRAEARAASDELIERFRTLAAGPLELVLLSDCSLGDGETFDALGYTFKVFSDDPDRLHVAISNTSFQKFKSKMRDHLDTYELDQVPREFNAKRSFWLNGFARRNGGEFSETYYENDLNIFLREYMDQRA